MRHVKKGLQVLLGAVNPAHGPPTSRVQPWFDLSLRCSLKADCTVLLAEASQLKSVACRCWALSLTLTLDLFPWEGRLAIQDHSRS